jgi:two-component system sensor histidine kinase HydH
MIMIRTPKFKRFRTGIPAWIFIGTAVILLPIFAFMTIANINRQKENMVRLLVEKGAALIRSFEAGTRTGMMGRMSGSFKLQRLLIETAQQPDIIHLLVTDIHGSIIADSDSNRIGERYESAPELEKLANLKTVQWRRVRQADGTEIFEVFRRFFPTAQPWRNRPEHMMMHQGFGRAGRQERNRPLPPQFIFVGLDTGSITAAQKADVKHTIVMGIVLLLIGSAGIVLLFLAQSYRTTRASLSRIKAFSDNLVENMPIGLVAVDDQQKIASFNHVAHSILGFALEKAVGQPAGSLLPSELWLQINRLAFDEGVIEKEVECSLNDGQRIPLAISATVLHDEDGTFLGHVLLLKDLREVYALRKEIQRNQRLASVGRLAAGVAHEIRNPLSSIKGFATYFKERYHNKPDDQQIANIMIQEVDRLNQVIGQLLDFARPVKISKKNVDLASLIENSIKLVERQAEEKSIEIQTGISDNIRTAFLDPDRVNQVLLNLYLNSLDAMENSGRLSVDVFAGEQTSELAIKVSDTGYGINHEDLAHIFDPYFTTKSTGTGLGLAIAHNIIEAHGGRIAVESNPGQGTAITVYLPVTSEEKFDEQQTRHNGG